MQWRITEPQGAFVFTRTRQFVIVAIFTFVCSAAAQRPQPSIKIASETYTLPNGLTVILAADHSTPTVAVTMWYHVGSKNETRGRTGFAHLSNT
jgi:zinc protease